jgi:hypothetical protein
MRSYQNAIDKATQAFIGAQMTNAVYNAVCFNDLWAILLMVGLGVTMLGVYVNNICLALFRRPREILPEPLPAKTFVDPRDEYEKAEELRLRAIADEAKAQIKHSESADDAIEMHEMQRSTVPNWKLKLDERRKTKAALSLASSQPQLNINTAEKQPFPSYREPPNYPPPMLPASIDGDDPEDDFFQRQDDDHSSGES